MFHTVVQQGFFRNGEKYYIYFIDNLLLFPTVKEFLKSINSWWSYRKKFDSTFFWDTV